MLETIILTIFGIAFIYFGLSCFHILLKPEEKKSITSYPRVLIRAYDTADRSKGSYQSYAYKVNGQYFINPQLKDVEEIPEVAQ